MPSSFFHFLQFTLFGHGYFFCSAWVASLSITTSQYVSVSIITSLNNVVNDDSEARSQFGTKEYWDELYLGRGDFPSDEYSWYFGWEGYSKYFKEYIPDKSSRVLIPGIGNDPILLDLLQNGYDQLTATDYSDHAIERQLDLISYQYSDDAAELRPMDARQMDPAWTDRFDAVIEKGCLDAIYLSGDGNLELTVEELERVVRPGGILLSISGVVPAGLRKEVFKDWTWVRDGTDDLKAGCFILKR